MPVPREVLELIERFDRNRDAYRSGQYNETQLRHEFIDPFANMSAAKTSHEKTAIQRQIDATDKQIHQSVYELYGLTGEEIKIGEEGMR
jgi:hypothetical protein